MKAVEDGLGEVGRKMLEQVVDVVGVLARFAYNDRDAADAVSSRHVGGKIEVKEFVVKWQPVPQSEKAFPLVVTQAFQ